MTSPVRVGIVGLGGIARSRHVPGLRGIHGVSIDAVANASAASSNAVARELGIPRAYGDWRHLIADPALDAVVVSTWPNGHAAAAIGALDAGDVTSLRQLKTDPVIGRQAEQLSTEAELLLQTLSGYRDVPAPPSAASERQKSRLLSLARGSWQDARSRVSD